MNSLTSVAVGSLLAAVLGIPLVVAAADKETAPASAMVQFGQPQFPQDPAPRNHFMDPDEVTIVKGGTVTFEINGANHGVAIYPVSLDTTREHIEAGLCQPDPATCQPQANATSDLEYFIVGGNGELVIDTQMNPPSNRVDDPTDRLLYAGGPVYFTGRSADGAVAPQVAYRFEKVGRYLVICVNRNHLINDRMFGFVNVVRKHRMIAE